MIILKIAFRNILRQKRRSILTGLSMFGGFVLAAFSIGWSDGSYNDVIDMFTRNQLGHIQIHHYDYLDRPALHKSIKKLNELESVLKIPGLIDSWAPRLFSAGLASVGEKTAGVRIVGIDINKEIHTTHFDQKIIKGSMFSSDSANEAIIGKGLAKLLNAKVGNDIIIISQGADGSLANDKYTIKGLSDTGDELNDRTSFYLPMGAASQLLVMENAAHEIAITVRHIDDVKEVTALLSEKIKKMDSNLVVEPWQIFAKEFYTAMKTDEKGQWVMLLIITVVVGVGVLNTVLMSVLERRREYGVLKAVGTKPGQVIKMVLFEVLLLTFFCAIAGSIVGTAINYYVSINGITLPEPMTYGGMSFSTMRAEINARTFYIPTITIFLTAFLAGIFPAIKAAHTDPARSMRLH